MYCMTVFQMKQFSTPYLTPDYDVIVSALGVSDVIKFEINLSKVDIPIFKDFIGAVFVQHQL